MQIADYFKAGIALAGQCLERASSDSHPMTSDKLGCIENRRDGLGNAFQETTENRLG